MSPEEFTELVVALSCAGLHYEALEVVARERDRLDAPLTNHQMWAVADVLQISAAAMPTEEWPHPEIPSRQPSEAARPEAEIAHFSSI